MNKLELPHYENKLPEIQSLEDFDLPYFQKIEGQNGWLALDQENCLNQRYFTVHGSNGEKLGIVGIYDTEDEKNITHTVVDKKYRGQGLANKFKLYLMDKLGLPFITMTIDLDNTASIRATEKLQNVQKISGEQYEQKFHKAKYVYERPKEEPKQ